MNWETMRNNWVQLKGRLQEAWSELSDDDLDMIAGRREQLLGTLQKRYGIIRDDAEAQVREFEHNLDCCE